MKPVDTMPALRWVFDQDLIPDWSAAIDGGACYGDWTEALRHRFGLVHAFEPSGDSFQDLAHRFSGVENVRLHNSALIDWPGLVDVRAPEKRTTRTARQVWPGEGNVIGTTIDALGLSACGLIKLDLEGCELLALEGAKRTIRRFRPVLIVEIERYGRRLGIAEADVKGFIMALGYRLVHRAKPDCVFVG